ncbi:MAG: hypothetical protein NTW32_22255 [Chloroflexi bacterium]|nr:hypothetical protein [Chloroflexota bacterium]
MTAYTIQKIDLSNARQVQIFLRLPYSIYRNIPQWVPPLQMDAAQWSITCLFKFFWDADERRQARKKQKSFGFSASIRENPRPIGVLCGLSAKSLETTLVIKI